MNDSTAPKVAILLSTYNGEKYLREQLDSIFSQSYPNIHLIVRDDGSKDDTIIILDEYSRLHPNITVLKDSNIGCTKSFFRLAQYASSNLNDFSYFSFCDQDDVWLPTKIEQAVNALSKVNANTPSLYFCGLKLVDKDLNPINLTRSNKSIPFNYTLGESLMVGVAAGCAMVCNKTLLMLYVMSNPENLYYHDDWMNKVCLACGGILIPDENQLSLYRQHGSNELGGNQSLLHKIKRRSSMFLSSNHTRSKVAQSLLDTYGKYMSEDYKSIVSCVANYRHSLKDKYHLLFSNKVKAACMKYNIMFKLAVMFNRF